MPAPRIGTRIDSSDFDSFVSNVAAAVWNRIVLSPTFQNLEPNDYAELFQTVHRVLRPYQTNKGPRVGGGGHGTKR